AAVELADAVEVRAKHDRVEQGSRAPHREPWARLGDHRLAELGAPEDRRTAEAQRPQPPVACEIQLLELNRGRAERRERREQGDEAGLSIRELCARARVTAPTVYHHFGDKGALLDRLVDACFAELDRAFTRRRSPADPVEALRWGFDRYVEYGLAHPSHYRLM